MKKLIVNVGAGAGLFVGALFGGLAATGRLNHDGTANIPLVRNLFPAPPVDPAADPNNPDAKKGEAGKAGEHGAPTDAKANGEHGVAADAAHAAPGGETKATGGEGEGEPQGQEPGKKDKDKPAPTGNLEKGKSIFQTEQKGGGEHGGGGGEHGGGEAKKDEHGAKKEGHGEAKPEEHGDKPAEHGAPEAHGDKGEHAAEQDFKRIESELERDRTSKYSPGGYFKFDGMPAGVTADKLNEAWQRVQEVTAELDKRARALDLRELEIKRLGDDIQRRWSDLGKERSEIEAMQAKLDERIERFKEQVKLIRNDEVAGLKKNAQTWSAIEATKVAELITEQWKMEGGQDEVLKTMEFMSKDKVNEILALLPNPMIRDVMAKRLRVSKEAPNNNAAAPAK